MCSSDGAEIFLHGFRVRVVWSKLSAACEWPDNQQKDAISRSATTRRPVDPYGSDISIDSGPLLERFGTPRFGAYGKALATTPRVNREKQITSDTLYI